MPATGGPAISVVGLKDLRRDLRAFAPAALRELRAQLREAAGPVATDAAARAPQGDPTRDPHAGQLAASVRAGATTTGAYIASRLPYAAVQEYGGTIAPRGAPISIEEHRFMRGAIDDHVDALLTDIDARLARVAQHHGFG